MSERGRLLAPFAGAALVALASCPGGGGSASRGEAFDYPPRHQRLGREAEEKLVGLIADIRKGDYLARVRAEGKIRDLMAKAGTDERAKTARYVTRLLNEPQWGVRAIAIKLLVEHGRGCPEAVAEFVQVLGDVNVNAPTRDAVARALTRWTGKGFGYDAFEIAPRVKAAAELWRKWLDETGGRIPPERGP